MDTFLLTSEFSKSRRHICRFQNRISLDPEESTLSLVYMLHLLILLAFRLVCPQAYQETNASKLLQNSVFGTVLVFVLGQVGK